MNRVVLDTNIIVSALLVPTGTQAAVLMLALTGHVALYVSTSVLAEYEVLRRPRLKLQPGQIDTAMATIRKVAHHVEPVRSVTARPMNLTTASSNAPKAPEPIYLVTGNTRHFPQSHKGTHTVTGRRFLDMMAESENRQ